jgi:heme-degrading monooxygenase HmoA
MKMHFAEFNIGRLIHPPGHPAVAEFINNVDRVNTLAERSPGFVWRLKREEMQLPENQLDVDRQTVYTLSVWENASTFESFVFKTVHSQFHKKGHEWFEAHEKPQVVFWPVANSHQPTAPEAMARLKKYQENGPTDEAFGWTELKDVERMRSLRCA